LCAYANLLGVKNWLDDMSRVLAENPMELLLPLAIFGVTFALGWLVRRMVLRTLNAWAQRTPAKAWRIVEESLQGPSWIWILILSAHLAIQSSDLPARVTSFLPTILLNLWVISLTLMCMRIARNFVRHYGDQAAGAQPVTTLTQNLAQITVLILGLLVMLGPHLSRLTGVLTALGVGGLAVALALQDTLSNLFAGFYVAISGQIRLGDYIKLNTGEEGYITDIGWRSTIIRAGAHNLIVIPNGTLAKANVTNFSLPEKRMASNVMVGVAPRSDVDRVHVVLREVVRQAVADKVPGLLAEPAPGVQFDPGFSESSLGFTVNYQVSEFSAQGDVRHELRMRIWRRFREEGIEIAAPQRAIFLKPEAPPSHL
jgi:small-conductance mechanosensitive channel